MKFLIIGFISLVLLPISITAAAIFIVASIVVMILATNLANSVTQEQMDEAYSRKSNEEWEEWEEWEWNRDFDPFYSHEASNIFNDD